jgi:hypothetical protein
MIAGDETVNTWADLLDHRRQLMTGNHRRFGPGMPAVQHMKVASANSEVGGSEYYFSRARLQWNFNGAHHDFIEGLKSYLPNFHSFPSDATVNSATRSSSHHAVTPILAGCPSSTDCCKAHYFRQAGYARCRVFPQGNLRISAANVATPNHPPGEKS